jgi:hypothetical protein
MNKLEIFSTWTKLLIQSDAWKNINDSLSIIHVSQMFDRTMNLIYVTSTQWKNKT